MKWLVAILLMATFAGCISDEASDSDSDNDSELPPSLGAGLGDRCFATEFEDPDVRLVSTDVDPIVDDRTLQWDFNSTNVRSCTLAAIGHHPLRYNGEDPAPHRYLGEMDTSPEHDLAAVAALGNGETPTVYILDITNRSNPSVLGTIVQSGTYITDVKFTDDGRYLILASQSLPAPGELAGLDELEPTAQTGMTLYDITDRANPSYFMTVPDSQVGCHMLSYAKIGSTHVIACVSQQVRVWGFEEPVPGTWAPLGFVDYLPNSGPMGAPLPSGIPAVGDPTGSLSSGPHDMTITYDEITGAPTMVVSHWGEGLRVVDLSDAPQATELGAWTGEGATHYAGNVHSGMMFYVNGTRYVMTSPEYTSGGNVPSLWLLDASDYGSMELVGEWYHPNEHDSQGLYLTTHQWQVAPTGNDVALEDVRIYMTMNHGGVWVIGFKEMLEGDLWGAIKGFHLSRTPLDQSNAVGNAVLNTWDVNLVDGYIYGTDRATGLWIMAYYEDELGDETRTGFA